jgi:hypothetical protein
MVRKLILPVLALGVLALVVAGCSHKTPTQPTTPNGSISNQFGGFTTSNETPGFGNPALTSSAAAGEKVYNDPMAQSATADSLAKDSSAGIYSLRIVWGRLTHDSSVTKVTDWSGSLSTTRGLELLRRTIHFEANDSILTRTDPKVIQWVSHTTTGSDGIAVDLVVPPMRTKFDSTITIKVDTLDDTAHTIDTVRTITVDTIPVAPALLTFHTAPYSHTFDVRDLAKLDTIVVLDDSNAIAFHAFRLERVPCPRGFLAGVWTFDSTNFGSFQGMWISPRFAIMGSFDGNFGLNDSAKMIFFGKWIDNSGNFQGLLRGAWGFKPNHHANENAFINAGGWFFGGIFDAQAQMIGTMKGKFRGPGILNPTGGFMQGRWKIICPAASLDDDGMEEDDNGNSVDTRPGDFEGGLHHGTDSTSTGGHHMGGGD